MLSFRKRLRNYMSHRRLSIRSAPIARRAAVFCFCAVTVPTISHFQLQKGVFAWPPGVSSFSRYLHNFLPTINIYIMQDYLAVKPFGAAGWSASHCSRVSESFLIPWLRCWAFPNIHRLDWRGFSSLRPRPTGLDCHSESPTGSGAQ